MGRCTSDTARRALPRAGPPWRGRYGSATAEDKEDRAAGVAAVAAAMVVLVLVAAAAAVVLAAAAAAAAAAVVVMDGVVLGERAGDSEHLDPSQDLARGCCLACVWLEGAVH